MGWATLTNGDLLSAAERDEFDVMLTADQRLRYQQRLNGRRVALVVVSLNSRTILLTCVHLLQTAVDRSTPGSYETVDISKPVLVRTPWPRVDESS